MAHLRGVYEELLKSIGEAQRRATAETEEEACWRQDHLKFLNCPYRFKRLINSSRSWRHAFGTKPSASSKDCRR